MIKKLTLFFWGSEIAINSYFKLLGVLKQTNLTFEEKGSLQKISIYERIYRNTRR